MWKIYKKVIIIIVEHRIKYRTQYLFLRKIKHSGIHLARVRAAQLEKYKKKPYNTTLMYKDMWVWRASRTCETFGFLNPQET